MAGSSDTQATLAEWVAREAVPFALDAPESFNAAVDTLMGALGGAVELLGMGEALHGGADILTLRNRLFQRLVEAHGFSAIAIESSFPRAHLVNEYAAGRGAAAYDAVQEAGFSHGFGRHEANRELVEWMRRSNAEPGRGVALRFYGFDSPTEMVSSDSPRRLLYAALDYLAALDSAGAQARRERIDALLGQDAAWENPAAMMDPAQSVGRSPAATALRIETEELSAELQMRRPERSQSDADRYAEAVHSAAAARQLLNYHALLAGTSSRRVAELLGLRDAMMADNLVYVLAREQGRGKVLVFAHNSHLQRGRAEWQLGELLNVWWPAGAHMHALMGARYAVIGSAVGVSEANGIAEPEAGALEAQLMAGPGPARFIPTHEGARLPVAEIAALPVRTGSRLNSTYFPLTPRSLTDFDWLAMVDRMA
jgi:erythromycin esterase-like protein